MFVLALSVSRVILNLRSPTPAPTTIKELKAAVDTFIQGNWDGDTYSSIGQWDVSRVTDMSALFSIEDPRAYRDPKTRDTASFNADISKWDVSRVTNMADMFYGATSFNVDISKWDVSRVTNMANMFYGAASFNVDISKWDVSRVTTGNMAKIQDGD